MEEKLGEKIIAYREKHGISVEAFARKCGVSMMTIFSLQKGNPGSRLTESKIKRVLDEDNN